MVPRFSGVVYGTPFPAGPPRGRRGTEVSESSSRKLMQDQTLMLRRIDASPPPRSHPGHWRPDIEGLRALAVGMVIASHIGFFYSEGGFVGVDVFFVISGFLITSLLLREVEKTGSVSLAKFYARRAVRLLPAAATVLLATLFAAWVWLPRLRLSEIAADATAAALNVVNFRLATEGTDYFNAEADPSPLQHFWSLAVEEQFYLVWPLMLLAVALIGRKLSRGHTGEAADGRRRAVVAVLLVVCGGASFLLSVTQSAADPVWSYFGIHTRAWELATGALVAVSAVKLRGLPGPLAAVASWAGLTMIIASGLLLTETTVFPGYAAALPVAGTALVIAAGCASHRGGATLLLGLAPAQFIGKISYGLYLWHWPIIMIGPAALGFEPRLRHMIALMVLAVLLSVAMFYLIENPIRTRKSLVQVPSRALALGGGLIASALAVSFVAVTQPLPTAEGEVAAEVDGVETTLWQLVDSSIDTQEVPANLEPGLADANADFPHNLYDRGCLVQQEQTELADDCVFGDTEADETMVLLGDSHAAQWFPPVNQLAQAAGYKLVVMTKASCSLPEVAETSSVFDREYTECEQWRHNAFDEIEEMEPELVLATNSDKKEVIADDPDQAWVDGWTETAERLAAATDELYVMGDTLWGDGDVPECLSEHLDDATACVYDLDETIPFPERRDRAAEAVVDAGAQYVDTIPWMCNVEERECPVIVGNLLVYRDHSHISASFASAMVPQIASALHLESAVEQEAG
ncbi:SGNH hydrolase domain-containing protein [Glycomyces albus]